MSKKLYIILMIILCMPFFIGCTDEVKDIPSVDGEEENTNRNLEERLSFSDAFSLEAAIKEGGFINNLSRSTNSRTMDGGFVSLLSKVPTARSLGDDEEGDTYYERFGYDTLVPNPNFAALLNTQGELVVANEVLRITPLGTFLYKIGCESELEEILSSDNKFEGDIIQQLSPNIILCKTFDGISYSMDEENSDLGENLNSQSPITRSYLGNDLNTSDFSVFEHRSNMLQHISWTLLGKKVGHGRYFNSKRRVKGNFYSYNYLAYKEIGVQGWTDKKNTFGWSKTAADEIRVGWHNVTITKKIATTFLSDLKKHRDNLKSQQANFGQTIFNQDVVFTETDTKATFNGKTMIIHKVFIPDVTSAQWKTIVSKGYPELQKYLKSKYGESGIKSQDVVIAASLSEMVFIHPQEYVIRYNTKSYTHVFDKSWMETTISWSNQKGFMLNNNKLPINGNANLQTLGNLIGSLYGSNHPKLTDGEVYVAARFGNDWKGMKIVYKN